MYEIREITGADLRNLCIEKKWFTRGTDEEYTKLLNGAEELQHVKTSDIVGIAENILRHSDTEYELSSVCFEIARICHSFFV